MGERAAAAAVQLIDVYGADECGRCTVSVHDAIADRVHEIRVEYGPETGVSILHARPAELYGLRVQLFVEGDREIHTLVAARVREAVEAYDPR